MNEMRFSLAMSTRPDIIDKMPLDQTREAMEKLSELLHCLIPGEIIMIRRENDHDQP